MRPSPVSIRKTFYQRRVSGSFKLPAKVSAAMKVVELQDEILFSLRDFPLKHVRLALELEMIPEVPPAAHGRLLGQALRVLADRVEAGDSLVFAARADPNVAASRGEAGESLTSSIRSETLQPAGMEADWQVPSHLHLKSVKTAHRFLVAAASLQERGPAPSLAEISKKGRVSLPPLYRILDAETEVGQYMQPLITVTKKGRAQVVDLTPLGRKVASKIRAGSLPA